MAWTLCTSGASITKAGANVNATIVASGAALERWSNEAESLACNLARYDVVTNFASLTANGKEIFQEFCSGHIAQKIIGYEPEAIGSFSATLRVNMIEDNITTAANMIKDDKVKTYLAIT